MCGRCNHPCETTSIVYVVASCQTLVYLFMNEEYSLGECLHGQYSKYSVGFEANSSIVGWILNGSQKWEECPNPRMALVLKCGETRWYLISSNTLWFICETICKQVFDGKIELLAETIMKSCPQIIHALRVNMML